MFKARWMPAPPTDPEQKLIAFTNRLQGIENELKVLPRSDPNRPNLEDQQKAWFDWVRVIGTSAPKDVRLKVFYGFEIQTLTGQLMSHFAVNNGVLVSNVIEDGKASRSGLKAGDIITEVGGKSITNLDNLIAALDAAGVEPFEITVSRHRERVKITCRH